MTTVYSIVAIAGTFIIGWWVGHVYERAKQSVNVAAMWTELGAKAQRPEGITAAETAEVIEHWIERPKT